MKVGTAFADELDAVLCGQKAARIAMASGGLARAGLVFAFCNSRVDPRGFYSGLRSVVGETPPIIGGSSVGVITNSVIKTEGRCAGVMILESDALEAHWAFAGDIDRDERVAGETVGRHLARVPDAKLLLLFYDFIKTAATQTSPPTMNASPPLINGLESAFAGNVPVIGAGLLGDLAFQKNYQFCGHEVRRQSAVGLVLNGGLKVYFRIMHGCTPQNGIYHTITRARGDTIFELDGKPIVAHIDAMYGGSDWQEQMPVKRLTLGVNYGDRFGDFEESCFVNRLIAGVRPQRDGIVLFEPDLPEGTEIMFMLRDAHEMIASARKNARLLMEKIADESATPLCALYIDCAGRMASYSETLTEEAEQVVAAMNEYKVPLLGFYSGVEIAPFLGKSRGLDWTGILLVLAR